MSARPIRLGSGDVDVIERADGTRIVRNREPLGVYPRRLTDTLDRWAHEAPERVFLAQREDSDWRRLTYAQAARSMRAVAAALVERGLSVERPVAILSENGIDHALLALGAQYAGIPCAAVSPPYSLASATHEKLLGVLADLTPGLVYADDGMRYSRALDRIAGDVEVVVSEHPHAPNDTRFDALLSATPGPALEAAHARVEPETIAKILFTSGSTGTPKGVINTQRMLTCNQEMLRAAFPFIGDRPPVVVDWLPWNHTFGGNHNFGLVLYNGGTLIISAGKPTPSAFAETLRNLREIPPTVYFDVPRGFEMLARALRADAEFRERFFANVDMLFYAAAGMSADTWRSLQELAVAATGDQILISTSLGSTETAPLAVVATRLANGPGHIGIPAPGMEAKLVPHEEKMELRLRGPNIMPAYWRDEARTHDAFDDEGFYCIGDAVRFADERDPARGFLFDGRLAEDFKLSTGTRVSAGPLRLRALAHFAPLVSDAVVSGENRDEIALLAFLDLASARSIAAGVPPEGTLEDISASAELRAHLQAKLDAFATDDAGSASRVARLVVLLEPPSLDAGEITDKGSLNARAVLRRRAEIVAAAHQEIPDPVTVLVARVGTAAK